MIQTTRLVALMMVALLQACATFTSPPPAEAPAHELPEAPAPAAAPAPSAALEVSKLPPFDGERREVKEPLRGIKKVDGAAGPQDVWQRIRRGFKMADLDDALVRRKTREYAAQREYLQRMFDRSRIYLFHIVEEIEKRGLPTELALLPMVESAFNPMAYSRAHASGLWQFVPATGRRFDLKQNPWYDGRRDIVASTGAALDYLTKLRRMHGDWHLALASYNWGENAVARAVAKNRAARKPTDYSSLRMPPETRQYVRKLQALKNIISNPSAYGIALDPIPNEPYFTVLIEPPELNVALAARLAEMPVSAFMALNPGFSRPLIRSSAGTRIVLPSDRVDVFHHNLAKHGSSLVSWQAYRPQHGETLGTIAKRFELSIAELKRMNGIPAASWRLPETLVVPLESEASTGGTKLPISSLHHVKPGDTLSAIAERYRVRLADLKRWNPAAGVLQVGQKIYIRSP